MVSLCTEVLNVCMGSGTECSLDLVCTGSGIQGYYVRMCEGGGRRG